MRGAALQVGQTLSAVDLGLVPEVVRPQFVLGHACARDDPRGREHPHGL
jgi:hypothetical protein